MSKIIKLPALIGGAVGGLLGALGVKDYENPPAFFGVETHVQAATNAPLPPDAQGLETDHWLSPSREGWLKSVHITTTVKFSVQKDETGKQPVQYYCPTYTQAWRVPLTEVGLAVIWQSCGKTREESNALLQEAWPTYKPIFGE